MVNERNLIPRIGGHHAGIPYDAGDKPPPLYLSYMAYDGTWLGMNVLCHYQLRMTVRWDKNIRFYYVPEYVYIGHKPPKETDVA